MFFEPYHRHRARIVHFDRSGLFIDQQNFYRSVSFALGQRKVFDFGWFPRAGGELDLKQSEFSSQDGRDPTQYDLGEGRGWQLPVNNGAVEPEGISRGYLFWIRDSWQPQR